MKKIWIDPHTVMSGHAFNAMAEMVCHIWTLKL